MLLEDTGDTGAMGYNPHRKFRARLADYIVLGTGLLVVVALVAWTAVG